MSGKAWIVTTGHYSDYSVRGVFTDEEKAQAFYNAICAGVKYMDVDIDEMELNPEPPKVETATYVLMAQDGTAENLEKKRYTSAIDEGVYCGFLGYHKHLDGRIAIRWGVATEDETRAVKTVNDIRAQIIALGIWDDEVKTQKLFGWGRWSDE